MRHSGNELINPFKTLERAGVQLGWHIADLGCGALGHFVFPAAQLVSGHGRVYAVDILKTALKAIEKTAKHEQFWNIVPVWSDIEVVGAARIPSGSLDLTIIANNLYLCQNRQGLIEEALRLTKPGGRMLVIEWKREQASLGPAHDRRISAEDAKKLFAHHDAHLLQAFEAGEHHYGLLYQKTSEKPKTEVLSIS